MVYYRYTWHFMIVHMSPFEKFRALSTKPILPIYELFRDRDQSNIVVKFHVEKLKIKIYNKQ